MKEREAALEKLTWLNCWEYVPVSITKNKMAVRSVLIVFYGYKVMEFRPEPVSTQGAIIF
jgi:hypothetical protein